MTYLTIDDVLEWMARLAGCDGVVSPSEQEILREFAAKYRFDELRTIGRANAFAQGQSKPEVEVIDYRERNGRLFENLIASFTANPSLQLRMLKWTGDKYFKGVYDRENLQPDFRMSLTVDKKVFDFFVECKWKHYWQKGDGFYFFELQQYQLDRYRKFEQEIERPVFIAHAFGRTGDNPRGLYIIPLNVFEDNIVKKHIDDKYYRIDIEALAFAKRIEHYLRYPNNV